MKRLTYIIMVLALVLSLTQCKKEQPQPQGEKVYITLKVCGDAKHTVTPGNGMVNYTTGDKIYVGNNGKYIGTLTHNGTAFSGEITDPQTSDYLHFYFIGGRSPLQYSINPAIEMPDDPDVPKAGATTSFTVSIADQSSSLPVLSYVRTAEKYAGGTSYTCMLENKCGLVKFVPSSPTSASVNLYGFYTTATIDFENGAITPNAIGNITLYSESNAAKWAILLPQTGVKPTATISGYTCSIEETVDVTDNCYNSTGVNISMTAVWDGDLSKITSETTEAFATATDGMTITGTLGVNKKISIADGATVTLDGVSINGVNDSNYEWAGITCLGDATIILSGTNTVKGFFGDYPGIQAAAGKTLIINGTGSLTASSYGRGAGIGAGSGSGLACGNIEIQGGTITATSGEYGAGIGGGNNSSWGNITISGGTVTATGGEEAAGIGGGRGYDTGSPLSSCGTITITTGVTKVTATKGEYATNSIGAGNFGTCGTVTIGGNVGAITTSPYTYQP